MNESILNVSAENLLQNNPFINNIVIALVWFFMGLIIGHIVGKILQKVLKEFEVDKTLKEKMGVKSSFEKIISGTISYSIYFIFTIIALNQVGITNLLLNIISIAVIIVLFISALLAIKDLIPNIIAYRQISKNIPKGTIIEINSVKGKVLEVNFSETKVETKQSDVIHIPNRLFLKEPHVRKKLHENQDNQKLSKFEDKKNHI